MLYNYRGSITAALCVFNNFFLFGKRLSVLLIWGFPKISVKATKKWFPHETDRFLLQLIVRMYGVVGFLCDWFVILRTLYRNDGWVIWSTYTPSYASSLIRLKHAFGFVSYCENIRLAWLNVMYFGRCTTDNWERQSAVMLS